MGTRRSDCREQLSRERVSRERSIPKPATPRRPKLMLKPWLVVDRLAVDHEALDRGAARRRNGCDDCDLPLVAGVFKLPALPLRNEIALNAVAHLQGAAAADD